MPGKAYAESGSDNNPEATFPTESHHDGSRFTSAARKQPQRSSNESNISNSESYIGNSANETNRGDNSKGDGMDSIMFVTSTYPP